MTITFKPSLQLHHSTLMAAISSQSPAKCSLDQSFLLCSISPAATDSPWQLAIWDGGSILVSDLHKGVDPSQRAIDMSINARAHLLYGNSKRHLDVNRCSSDAGQGRGTAERLPQLCDGALVRGSSGALLSCNLGLPMVTLSLPGRLDSSGVGYGSGESQLTWLPAPSRYCVNSPSIPGGPYISICCWPILDIPNMHGNSRDDL